MKKQSLNKISRVLAFVCLGLFTQCAPSFENPKPSPGTLHLSKVITVGDTYFAGYADNALYKEGQEYSIGNLLAKQLQTVGAGEFLTPYVPTGVGLGTPILGNNAKYILVKHIGCDGVETLEPVPADTTGDMSILTENLTGTYQNLGIPLIKSFDAFNKNYGLNPYFTRLSPNGKHLIQMVTEQTPTFVPVWIGGGDILLFAAQGGINDSPFFGKSSANGMGILDMTPADSFQKYISLIVDNIQSTGAQMVIANYPEIASLPIFNTIPYDTLMLTAAEADSMNIVWAGKLETEYTFKEGKNPLVVRDNQGKKRVLLENEKPLLTAMIEVKCKGYGKYKALVPEQFLETSELEAINERTDACNQILAELAQARNIPLVDMHAFFKSLEHGYPADGIIFNSQFILGGFFSLDGLHPCPRGNALVTNIFIDVINKHFNASIPMVPVSEYPGVAFP